jgi:hypothetical protein
MPWRLFFRTMYRGLRLADPVVRLFWRRRLPWFGRIVDLRVAGRRTGRPRQTLVTLLTVDGTWDVGHPNGAAEWTSNLLAAGGAELRFAGVAAPLAVAADRLPPGPERDGVIRATWSQQPFPGNLVYSLARRHVRATGVYFRLTPLDASPSGSQPHV